MCLNPCTNVITNLQEKTSVYKWQQTKFMGMEGYCKNTRPTTCVQITWQWKLHGAKMSSLLSTHCKVYGVGWLNS